MSTLKQALLHSLAASAKVNSSVLARPAAILWTDAESVWRPVFPALRQDLPGLLQLGTFNPEQAQGPAIWLKCAVGGQLPELVPDGHLCVIYLPGISRADLRAIESCPRDLQPLAELQYRGVFWSQLNGKDWTINAFLTSRNGGLGLDVAQDKATQEALGQALAAGVLLDRSVQELKGRQINAEWLHSLLAPNPTRDLLVWMDDPDAAQALWGSTRWDVFLKRCKADFGFHPVSDGPLAAAERLARGDGKWSAVAELYRDSFASFSKVYALLLKVAPPPQQDLFDAASKLAGYPQVNEQKEEALRYALAACGAMTADQARAAILAAEQGHGLRRDWLWTRMGLSPLGVALGHLAEVASRSAQLPAGSVPDQLAQSYQDSGWQVDAAALRVLGAVQTKTDLDAVSAALRAVYLPWIEESARRLQTALMASGGLSAAGKAPDCTNVPAAGVCTVFVDGLRYDVAVALKERLAVTGKVELAACWTSLPSVTASGKAWCSPVAHLVSGDPTDQGFEPRVAADGKPLSGHHFRKLLADSGIQPLDTHETGDPSGRAWTEAGDLDHYGHAHGVRLARDLDAQLAQVLERICELQQAGWKHLRIVTDHGWLLMPGGLPKSELATHETETKWGRCAVLKDNAHGTPLTFGWSWCDAVQVAYAPGVSCFIAGIDYAHGGLSLQECLVPVLSLEVERAAAADVKVDIRAVTWKGLRCLVEVETMAEGLTVDIRTKAALASTSLVASRKGLDGGKANLAVADDDQEGSAAVVVVLSPGGEVVQKVATTVGGS
ncbi:BREX-1 system phosphatase PglZ type B [uncultured Thiodictyon sp.]|uniref:BREX-1 system phosphatase PglZ type B n=1 Tax=uncultured Thiodictyon sp. TaxID=1846217 RepID=UPI0025D765A1|nr:BREX-1 system phosphatase PglZ type B [uncultured Thiodictyon sp.]